MEKVIILNLLLDLGGVLLNYDMEADTEALQAIGLPEYAAWDEHPELSEITNLYLNGLMDADTFCDRIQPYCNEGVTRDEMLWSMQAVLADLPACRLQQLKQLRQKYHIYLLSNLNEPSWQHTLQQFEKAGIRVDECFDRVFLSYEMQLAKPDRAIYEAVVEATGIKPEETLYVEDSTENYEAGKAFGFRSVKVEINHPETVLDTLLKEQ